MAQDTERTQEKASWDGPEDGNNPYNWPSYRKITVGIVCSASQLVTTMSASMIAPALDQILHDLKMSTTTGQIAFSVFFLGLGFAPFLVAALSETYGRRPVWIAGNIWYIIWNSLCPVGSSPAMMIIGRFMSASGASVGITLTAPVLSDVYKAKDRGKAMAIASLLPYIGPALGPIIGGLAAQHLWWPWLFWILSAFDAACLAIGFFVIRETYAPVLLQRKATAAALAAGLHSQPTNINRVAALKGVIARLGPALSKPVGLLVHRPVIQLIAVATAIDFGIYTIVLSTFASLWITRYHESETTASLHYVAIALGAICCAQGGGPLMDLIWHRMNEAKPNSQAVPENRVPYMAAGFIPGIAGLFWYAWTAEKMIHWAVVDIGVFFFVVGTFMFSQGLLAYMVDEVSSTRAASASAATRLGSYVLGFVFPIFAPQLYEKLGYGWGNSLLGLLLLVLVAPVPLLLWFWGDRLRAIGRTAEDERERTEM